jgi:drug/metabolite transporter (DMT)-like permease
MSSLIPPQFIALAAALSYAASGIAAKRGLRYSTPITVTLVSVTVHAVSLSIALWLTGGIPEVSWWVLFLFALTGTLQPIIRLFTYAAGRGSSRSISSSRSNCFKWFSARPFCLHQPPHVTHSLG